MGATPIYGLRYLDNPDPPNIPLDGQNSMLDVEAQIVRLDAALAPVPAQHYQAANDSGLSTSYVGGTQNGIAFTAPPSGTVLITFSGWIGSNAVSGTVGQPVAFLSDHVRTGSTIGAGTDVLAADDARSVDHFFISTVAGYKYGQGHLRHLVTGLTPGSSYNVVTVARSGVGGATAAVNRRYLLVEPAL